MIFKFKVRNLHFQRAKKIVSNSLGLVDFAIRLVNSVLNFSDGQVKFLGGVQITEELQSIRLVRIFFRQVKKSHGLIHAISVSYKTDVMCSLTSHQLNNIPPIFV